MPVWIKEPYVFLIGTICTPYQQVVDVFVTWRIHALSRDLKQSDVTTFQEVNLLIGNCSNKMEECFLMNSQYEKLKKYL